MRNDVGEAAVKPRVAIRAINSTWKRNFPNFADLPQDGFGNHGHLVSHCGIMVYGFMSGAGEICMADLSECGERICHSLSNGIVTNLEH